LFDNARITFSPFHKTNNCKITQWMQSAWL
jgi:hypothetical protein